MLLLLQVTAWEAWHIRSDSQHGWIQRHSAISRASRSSRNIQHHPLFAAVAPGCCIPSAWEAWHIRTARLDTTSFSKQRHQQQQTQHKASLRSCTLQLLYASKFERAPLSSSSSSTAGTTTSPATRTTATTLLRCAQTEPACTTNFKVQHA